jgi:hypothetical protein
MFSVASVATINTSGEMDAEVEDEMEAKMAI